MRLVDRWTELERGLDPSWRSARIALTVEDEARARRAAQLLAPGAPGRSERTIRLVVTRDGRGGVGPEAVRRMFRRLDAEPIAAQLELLGSDDGITEQAVSRATLASSWQVALDRLPADWSDLYCELELTSTDHLERGALLLAPLNPLRSGTALVYRFRCARMFGYGASAEMVRRCLERLDEADIPAQLRIVHALSDTHPIGTQGPVWHLDGRTV